jgi:hypothetical protein
MVMLGRSITDSSVYRYSQAFVRMVREREKSKETENGQRESKNGRRQLNCIGFSCFAPLFYFILPRTLFLLFKIGRPFSNLEARQRTSECRTVHLVEAVYGVSPAEAEHPVSYFSRYIFIEPTMELGKKLLGMLTCAFLQVSSG